MKIIIAPDKFKGSLTSFEVCHAIAEGIRHADETAMIFLFPMADGGDGFAEVMKHYLQTSTIDCTTVDPLGRNIRVSYQWNSKRKMAIIEMAVASGLVLLKHEERDPLKTSAYGTGLLIKDAIDKGAGKIILGLGGSATNDAGTGILSALGFQFEDAGGKSVKACGENLLQVEKIIPPPFIPSVKFEIACDVQNILYGPQGAAYVYGPQKGADTRAVKLLDKGLKHFATILRRQTGKDIATIPGTGAAGGIAAGLMGFFDVELKKGIDLVIDASGIKKEIGDSDLLITGEGRIDEQSLEGKVINELSLLAHQHKVAVAAFCGITEAGDSVIKQLGLQFIEGLVSSSVTREEAMKNAKQLLTDKASQFFRKYFSKK